MITIFITEAVTVLGNSMMLFNGIPCSITVVKYSQFDDSIIRTFVTTRFATVFKVDGVPILTRVILAVPPKLNLRYGVQDKPSLKAGDHTKNLEY